MKTSSRIPARSFLLYALALAAALGLAACGGDDGGDGGADPATLTPADSPVYFEAAVRPEGDQKDELLAALGKLLNSDDVGAMITDTIESELEGEDVNYSEDIEPWLGQNAAFFLDDFSGEEPSGAAVVSVTDQGAAEDAIDKFATDSGEDLTEETYEGVSYKKETDSDSAVGIVDDFLVAGTEPGFQAAVDASGADSLADNSEATDALDSSPGDPLFRAYVDPQPLFDFAVESGEITQKDLDAATGGQLETLQEGAVVISGAATADSFSFDVSAPAGEGMAGTEIVSTLPAESWLALGAPMVGEAISMGYQNLINSIQSSLDGFDPGALPDSAPDSGGGGLPGLPGGQVPDIQGEIKKQLGIDLSEDLDWAGDLGLFIKGGSIFELGAGIVIETDDEEAAAATVDQLQQAVAKQPDVQVSKTPDGFEALLGPAGAEVAIRDGKVVVAIAGVTVDEVLSPEGTLGDESAFQSASDQLGEGLTPAFYLDFPTVLALAEGSGQVGSDPGYQAAKPYLDALSYLVVGGGTEGDRSKASFVLGVREGSGGSDAPAASIAP